MEKLETRQHEPELMDDPALDKELHLQARAGLARLNILSGAAHTLLTPLAQLMRDKKLSSLKVLDIATGSADVPLRLARIAKRASLDIQVDGCDFSDTALEHARQKARAGGLDKSQFFELNVLKDEIPAGYDVVICSLFAHHLDEKETIHLLQSMKKAAKRMVILTDLERSPLNHSLVWLACRMVTSSKVVRFDGPASVRNAYTLAELSNLAAQAGMENATVYKVFPCRIVLAWRKD